MSYEHGGWFVETRGISFFSGLKNPPKTVELDIGAVPTETRPRPEWHHQHSRVIAIPLSKDIEKSQKKDPPFLHSDNHYALDPIYMSVSHKTPQSRNATFPIKNQTQCPRPNPSSPNLRLHLPWLSKHPTQSTSPKRHPSSPPSSYPLPVHPVSPKPCNH